MRLIEAYIINEGVRTFEEPGNIVDGFIKDSCTKPDGGFCKPEAVVIFRQGTEFFLELPRGYFVDAGLAGAINIKSKVGADFPPCDSDVKNEKNKISRSSKKQEKKGYSENHGETMLPGARGWRL